jgi:hypothetical protein
MKKMVSLLSTTFLLIFILGCTPHKEESSEMPVFINGHDLSMKLDRNVILFTVNAGGKSIDKIILDSGMPFEGLMLFHKEYLDSINYSPRIRVTVPGAGGGDPSQAIMFDSVSFFIDSTLFDNQRILILESEHTQNFPTNGVVGHTIFKAPVIGVDFDREILTIADSVAPPGPSWTPIPITLNRNHIPELTIEVAVEETDSLIPMKVYLDLAARESIELLVKPESRFSLPGDAKTLVVGTGLNGDILGSRGTVYRISIGNHVVSNQPATFPEAAQRSKQGNHYDGVIGCGLMQHFNIIFDYPNHLIYIQPRKK